MSLPLILMLDGGSPPVAGLEEALTLRSLAVKRVRVPEAKALLESGFRPALVVLDGPEPGSEAWSLVDAMAKEGPGPPVVLLCLRAGGPTPAGIRAVLDCGRAPEELAEALQACLPEGAGRESGTLEGLLDELGRGVLPPADPFDFFGSSSDSSHRGKSDFTLSGIPGVEDPFDWPGRDPGLATPLPPEPVPPGVLEEYGNYFLLERIGLGGMAEVFKAQQRGVEGFQKIVAIKRILPHCSDNPDFVRMFIDEAKLAAQLTHPNIVQIFDLGRVGDSYYIAMEYVNGWDLRSLLRKAGELGSPFPEEVAAFVVMRVAAALDHAHRKRGFDDRELKLVHRDISPQNVILAAEGAVKLVDFGIAKAASKAGHTHSGALKGKILYMSPEQAMGQPLDNRSDLYSLGLLLFELLTGQRCFFAESELAVLEKVRQGRIQDLLTLNPTVSKELVAIVNRALQKDVDHRYPSARFMERDLREALGRQGRILTEHDVAEYLQALLGGSREVLRTFVATRFPAAPPAAALPPPALLSPSRGTPVLLLEPEPPAAEPAPLPPPDQRPRWLLPVILALAAALIAVLTLAGGS